ncbi:MAG: hypothetical protein AB8B73_03390 [Ekhidna sp.]
MRITLFILIFTLALATTAQRRYIHGIVKDSSITNILGEAHIKNITSGKLAVLDPYGKFRIPAQLGDTIIITHIGFENLIETVSKNWFKEGLLEFSLNPDPTFLPEVVINEFPDYTRFKQMILEAEPESELEVYGMNAVPKFEKNVTEDDLSNSTVGLSVGIPIDLDVFSKKGKEKKKMQKILQNKRNIELANKKFNREWVAEMTDLKGEELTSFIAYCKFSIDYLVKTSVYDIHHKMMALLDDFKSEGMDS